MSMFKFLPGILVAQAATAALIFAGTGSATAVNWVPLAALAFIVTVLVALWFGSIADHVKKDAVASAVGGFARERERLLVAAEMDKRSALEQTHQRIVRETSRVHASANLKLGLGLAGLLSLGGLMLAIEFMTFGLLLITTAGGALGGYLARARQDALAARKNAAEPVLIQSPSVKLIEGERQESSSSPNKSPKSRT